MQRSVLGYSTTPWPVRPAKHVSGACMAMYGALRLISMTGRVSCRCVPSVNALHLSPARVTYISNPTIVRISQIMRALLWPRYMVTGQFMPAPFSMPGMVPVGQMPTLPMASNPQLSAGSEATVPKATKPHAPKTKKQVRNRHWIALPTCYACLCPFWISPCIYLFLVLVGC